MTLNDCINSPDLWLHNFPWPQNNHHKYDRGHALVVGGPLTSTGATKLAALSALRVGAGLVSVVCDETSLPVYAACFTSVMTKVAKNLEEFTAILDMPHIGGVLIGPGAGITPRTREFIFSALSKKYPLILDADALTVFAETPRTLFSSIDGPCILTPHAGEFARLFPGLIKEGDRRAAAQKAACLSQAVVVLKGTDTIIAAPDGRSCINENASPFLATAGSGDVLAGLCLGLLTQGMEIFDAACAAVWLHTQAASLIGPGLISEDLPDVLPQILAKLHLDSCNQ